MDDDKILEFLEWLNEKGYLNEIVDYFEDDYAPLINKLSPEEVLNTYKEEKENGWI